MHTKPFTPLTEEQKMRSHDRAHVILFIWLLLAFVIVLRAFYIQVVQHEKYTDLGTRQYVSSVPINFNPAKNEMS